LIATKLPKNYDRAVELSPSCETSPKAPDASGGRLAIKELHERHHRKPTLMERFAKHKLVVHARLNRERAGRPRRCDDLPPSPPARRRRTRAFGLAAGPGDQPGACRAKNGVGLVEVQARVQAVPVVEDLAEVRYVTGLSHIKYSSPVPG